MAEVLIGHAVAMPGLPFDHTYVTSSAGDRWGCKGRERGGRIISRGSGRLALAQCLACPEGMAGVDYGVTGVCFQIANRILWPAAILVEQARGYNRLFKHFGHFGLDRGRGPFWPERDRCLDELREPQAAYVMQSDPFIDEAIQRMNVLLDRAFGERLDPGVRARVEQIVAATAARQRELVLAFEDGKIAPQSYLEAFNELVATDFRRLDEVLGRDAFLAIFGEPPEVAAKIIDPKAFAAAHALDLPRNSD